MKIIAIVVVILLVAGVALFALSRANREQSSSFWDILRSPDRMPDFDEFHRHVDDEAKALSGSPVQIAELVDRYVFVKKSRSDAWTELRTLAKLGDEAYPRALAILRDPGLEDRLTALTTEEYSLPKGPINRLCEIFDQDAPPPKEAAELLAPYLGSESDEIRKSAALTIGSIASEESFPDLHRALTDKEEYVRSYALMGIQRAIASDRVVDSSKHELYTLVASMWPGDTSFNVCDSIPLVLLKLDRERALEYLLSDALFSTDFKPLWRILEAMNKESIVVPRVRLLAIIAEASKEPIKYPMDNVIEHALPLLAAHREDEDQPMFERLLTSDNESVSTGATEALYRFHHYYERIRDPWDFEKENGWDTLTVAERHICAVRSLDGEINNGGFAQYYFNSSSDRWQDALDGLAVIGANKRHQIMLATIEQYGNTKPAVDRGTRTAQLSTIVRKKEDPFNEQDNAWYETKDENLERLILVYNLANLEGRETEGVNPE